MVINQEITERFSDYIFNWDYETYLLVGGYGSGKSHSTALKIVLKLLQERRTALVVRQVYETLKDSCYSLIKEILDKMNLLVDEDDRIVKQSKTKVKALKSPLEFIFPNKSRIIFRGMDKPDKLKSLNDVSIVWLEECPDIKYEGYKELLGRIRTPDVSMHYFLTCNPVSKSNWVYTHFFISQDKNGNDKIILDDEKLYKKKMIVKNGVYYLHSTCDDNPFLPEDYIKRLNDIKNYDRVLYRIARHGRFGAAGIRVLPQFTVAKNATKFKDAVKAIPQEFNFYGFDFGFEESYNAVISMAVDVKRQYLYIYDEIYVNHITDDLMSRRDDMQRLKAKQQELKASNVKHNMIVADNEDPKAIAYYRQQGFEIRACRNKFAGSRLSNTRKVKRFRKIICSPKCVNTIRELKDLTYLKKNGITKYDEFVIDPHTFSAIWYALDTYTVADLKDVKRNSRAG